MRIRECNWMQVEEYLERDDRIVVPLGSTEQHGYLSLETDNVLAERVSAEAAEPLGVLVLAFGAPVGGAPARPLAAASRSPDDLPGRGRRQARAPAPCSARARAARR